MAVAEVFDTGTYEPVYNLRVAEYHTYFVGKEAWGWALWAHNDYNRLADVLRNAPEVASTTDDILINRIAKRMPQAQSARDLSLAAFTRLLETKLYNQQLLPRNQHLSEETAQAAKDAAEIHGNTGRSPTILIDPTAPNPYPSSPRAARLWDEITAFAAAHPAVVGGLRLRLQLPGQPYGGHYRGLPYHFLRAQHYAALGELVEVERPTQSPSDGNGECDLLLTGNRLVDCKAWSPAMWSAASLTTKRRMIDQLTNEVRKYLGDPTGYTLRFEFRYAIPTRVLARLVELAADPAFRGRLTWEANVT